MPEDNACCDADVQTVLRAVLRYFKTAIAHIHNVLLNTLHLISQHYGILSAGFPMKVLKQGASLTLLNGKYRVAKLFEPTDGILCLFEVTPRHTILSSEGRLVDFRVRRLRGDTTKTNACNTKGIARAEHTTHVVKTPHMVEHHNQRLLFRCLILGHIHSAKLRNFQLPHLR